MTARSKDGPHDIHHDGEQWVRSETDKPMPDHRPDQVEITTGGETFWADCELVPLLHALNDAGLKTSSHCAGHDSEYSNVIIDLDPVIVVEVWMGEKPEKRLHLVWKRPEKEE